MADKNPLFATKPDDPKDVSWGLTTADACWRRGERSDALRWLRRAVESASEAEADDRALELAKIAADLATQIGTMAPPPPQPKGAASPSTAPGPIIPRAPAVPTKPLPARTAGPTPLRTPPTKEAPPPKKADRKSITNEAKAKGGQAKPAEKPEEKADKAREHAAAVEALPPARKRSPSKTEVMRQPSRTDEIDQWPTEVKGALEASAPAASEEIDAADAMPQAAPQVVAAQALRVFVWREPNGDVHVVAAGVKSAPLHAVEATLVAGDATTDLVALLRDEPA